MKTKMLFATLLTLVLVTAGHAQTLDKAKLDQLFDRLARKEQGDGQPDSRQGRQRSLQPLLRLQPDQRERKETFDRGRRNTGSARSQKRLPP